MIKILLTFLLTFFTIYVYANDKFINVFVTVDNVATKQIKSINTSMNDAGLYGKYNITPFINNHLVHLTMYLTYYDESEIANILPKIKNIAKDNNQFEAKILNLELKPSNFLMLNLTNTSKLQNLSDKIVNSLYILHSKNIIIPDYAKNDPVKVKLFEQYGSPSVFKSFEPHFSIFAGKINHDKNEQFNEEINKMISNIKLTKQSIKITGIGVGEADINGQITQVIKIYKLS